MDISIVDKAGSGILAGFAKALGVRMEGRYVYIPEDKGGGYLTGFSWGNDMRMMIRNYHLHHGVSIEWTNHAIEGQEPVVFQLSGIFPAAAAADEQVVPERSSVLICRQTVTSVIAMPSDTAFSSVTIAVFLPYLQQMFGHLGHPAVQTILERNANFAYETTTSPAMFSVASEMHRQSLPAELESQYYKLKCEELLCHIFSMLIEREPLPASQIHLEDIRAIYAIKQRLQSDLGTPPDIVKLSKDAGMSDRKLRRLFNQIFGKPVFEYFQWMRMQEAARLLRSGRLTVSEVGYQLGFTNLGHFTRVFEQHHGIKPKKYSLIS